MQIRLAQVDLKLVKSEMEFHKPPTAYNMIGEILVYHALCQVFIRP